MSNVLTSPTWRGLLALALLSPSSVGAEEQPSARPAAEAPAAPAELVPPAGNPFARLKEVIPVDQLPPLRSVRIRGDQEKQDRARGGKIAVTINSSPRGARVLYGGKLLGTTPLTISAPRYSTPQDVVLRRGGYMTLHARIKRLTSRSYYFKLTPAKFH